MVYILSGVVFSVIPELVLTEALYFLVVYEALRHLQVEVKVYLRDGLDDLVEVVGHSALDAAFEQSHDVLGSLEGEKGLCAVCLRATPKNRETLVILFCSKSGLLGGVTIHFFPSI